MQSKNSSCYFIFCAAVIEKLKKKTEQLTGT